MNSTPNYHFEKTAYVCGISDLDRELRRVEDKVNCVAQSLRCGNRKPNCGGGHGKPSCNCNCGEELRDIRDELTDRYTKEEADNRIDEKIGEHNTDPDAHEDIREELDRRVNARNANVAFYVSKSGDDAWEGSENRPFLTVQRAIDEVGKTYGNHYANIIVDDGTYQEKLELQNLLGLTIRSKNEDPAKVIIESSKDVAVSIHSCMEVYLLNLTFVVKDGYNRIINAYSTYVMVVGCVLEGALNYTDSGSGVHFSRGATGSVTETQISNTNRAISAAYGAVIGTYQLSGSNNTVAYLANFAIIMRDDKTPEAQTLEAKANGGQIFS